MSAIFNFLSFSCCFAGWPFVPSSDPIRRIPSPNKHLGRGRRVAPKVCFVVRCHSRVLAIFINPKKKHQQAALRRRESHCAVHFSKLHLFAQNKTIIGIGETELHGAVVRRFSSDIWETRPECPTKALFATSFCNFASDKIIAICVI